MRKVDDGKKEKKEKKKRMSFLEATNVVYSRPTGTPHARAKRGTRTDGHMNTLSDNVTSGAAHRSLK